MSACPNDHSAPYHAHFQTDLIQALLQDTDKACCFRCGKVPPISVKAYILRIAQYSKCSPVCFMMAWSYLKRFTQV